MNKRMMALGLVVVLGVGGWRGCHLTRWEQIGCATVFVRFGDSLWSIGEQHRPRGMDIRRYLREMEEQNAIEGHMLYGGQALQVPIYQARR